MSDVVSERLRAFILAHIESIEVLEVLLILAARPATDYSASSVAHQLGTMPAATEARLRYLRDHRLVDERAAGCFRLSPDPELKMTVGDLAEAYLKRRLAVITLISSRQHPDRRV